MTETRFNTNEQSFLTAPLKPSDVPVSTDLANEWDQELLEGADLEVVSPIFDTQKDLATSVINSLFSDGLALASDELPTLFSDDRKGWWGSTYLLTDPNVGQAIGSRLWLLTRHKSTPALLATAKQYCEEALAWLTRFHVTSSFTVETFFIQNQPSLLGIKIFIIRKGESPVKLEFQYVWDQINNRRG